MALVAGLPLALPSDWLLSIAEEAIALATGWLGLAIVFGYSFVLGFAVLPLPSELVLFAPLELGFSKGARLAFIVVASGLGKAVGSVLVLWISVSIRESDPVQVAMANSRFRIHEWSRSISVRAARRYGYPGMAILLSVPMFPDTASVYAFSVLEDDYLKFSAAAFTGSVGRLVVVATALEGTIGL